VKNINYTTLKEMQKYYDTTSAEQDVRRGSVVRASVSDWRTFPDMRLIYG